MIWLPDVVSVIYYIAQVIAGVMGVGVFIWLLVILGFNSEKTSGDSTVILVGANFIGSVLAGLLVVFPLLVFETDHVLPPYPNEFFQQSFWIIYAFILLGSVLGANKVIRKITPAYLAIPLLGLVTASWVAKTLGVAIFTFNSPHINWFLKLFYALLDLGTGVLYLALAGFITVVLSRQDKAGVGKKVHP